MKCTHSSADQRSCCGECFDWLEEERKKLLERIRELEQQLAHATQMAILATQRAEQSESRERILSEQLEEVHRALDVEVNNKIQKGEEWAEKLEQQLEAAQERLAKAERLMRLFVPPPVMKEYFAKHANRGEGHG